jgi:predicted Zn-ribbon and HTH transcriptional regulator
MRRESDTGEIKDAYVAGLGVIVELYSQEVYQTYKNYTSEPIYQRYSTRWEERAKSVASINPATVTVGISCGNCGYSFQPRHEGWKHCPECDSPHDYLEKFSTPDG